MNKKEWKCFLVPLFMGLLFMTGIMENGQNVYAEASVQVAQQTQIDLNSASYEELQQIYGVGPVIAQRVIDARPYESIDDLIKVNGIGSATLQKIKEQGIAYVKTAKTIAELFPDSTLANKVASQLSKSVEDYVDQEELNQIHSLYLYYDEPYATLEGIQLLEGLEIISAQGELPDDLTKIFSLQNLESLTLGLDRPLDISGISNLEKLKVLGFYYYGEEEFDFSQLYQIPNLSDLYINSIGSVSLARIDELSNLTSLEVSGKLENVSDIGKLTNLFSLVLGNHNDLHKTFDLTEFQNLTKLTNLGIDSITMTETKWLSSLTNLESVYISNSQLDNLSAFSALTNLKHLGLQNNQLENIGGLSELQQLTSLSVTENLIKDISPVEKLTSLTELYLYSNQIEDVTPLTNLTNLKKLTINDNKIQNVQPLGTLTALTSLSLGNNEITDIYGLKDLTKLTDLSLINNSVKDISILENLTNLYSLSLINNQVEDIKPLRNLGKLRYLNLADNNIEDIFYLMFMTKLVSLNIMNNPVKDYSPLNSFGSSTSIWK